MNKLVIITIRVTPEIQSMSLIVNLLRKSTT